MIATAAFGRTGHDSTRVIFGAAALGAMRQDRADDVLAQLLHHGINHIDTAASYGDSELRIGPWMAEHRSRFFLATKTGERTADGARASLERSLERLQVDSVDLIQLHNLVEPDEWEVAHGPGGAVEGLVRSQEEGLVRHIGVTGHGTRIAAMHVRSLERHPFASVLLPYSYVGLQHDAYRADVEALLALCAARQVAVQTIKAVGRRRWPEGYEGPRFSWYEPVTEPAPIARAVRWVLDHPQLFLNTSSDARLLPTILEAAAAPGAPPTDEELQADIAEHGIEPLFDGGALERILSETAAMPKAYVLVELAVTDPEAFEAYKTLSTAALAAHGGRYLAHGGTSELLEGAGAPARVTLLEFPDLDTAKAWYASPEYREAKASRANAATGRFVVVEGLEDAG